MEAGTPSWWQPRRERTEASTQEGGRDGGRGSRAGLGYKHRESLTNVEVALGLPAVLQVVHKRVAHLPLQSNSQHDNTGIVNIGRGPGDVGRQ